MITKAPLRHDDQPATSERPTAPLQAAGACVRDAVSLLDHRSRGRLTPAHMANPGPHLALQDGEGELLVPIGSRILHIGRGSIADLRFEEARVSRRHAIVVRHGRQARLLDDRSSSGTFVNGQRIVTLDLTDGDVIRVGPVALRYVVIS